MIEAAWQVPPASLTGITGAFRCVVRVEQSFNGRISNETLAQTCGHRDIDQSLKNALVQVALPVTTDESIFEPSFELVFDEIVGHPKVRTLRELQAQFDATSNSFIELFQATPKQKDGKMVVLFTVEPSGGVSEVRLQSSDLENPHFEGEVLAIIRRMQFENRPVPPITYPNYPILFKRRR